MAEHGKFWLIVETKLLLGTWSQDHIQKQLRAAVQNDVVFGKIAEVLAKRGYYPTMQQCCAKIKAGLIQCSPSSGTSVSRSLGQTRPKYANIQTAVTDTTIFALLRKSGNE